MRKVIFLALIGVTLTSCYKKELESANAENNQLSSEIEKLKSEIIILTAENTKLKETAQYYFQQGKDNLEASKFAEAITAFNAVVDRFPSDQLVPLAKKSLTTATKAQAEEVRKKEALQAQCKEILGKLADDIQFLASEGAASGYEGNMSGTVDIYKNCVAACSDKGINCKEEAKSQLYRMCAVLNMTYPPDQVRKYQSFGEKALSRL